MSFEAKAGFLNRAETELANTLTVNAMNQTLRILADIFQDYELTEIGTHSEGKDDLLKTYLDTLRIQGRSPKTIERYRYILGRLKDETQIHTRQITVYHLRNWLATEKERGLKDTTLEGFREIFSAYFNWLHREDLIDRNPAANLGAIKCMKKKKEIYSAVDLEKLNDECIQIRDRAIVAFLQSTGCRISEMTELNRDAVDLNKLRCKVLGKGNKERIVYIDAVAGMYIEQYLASRTDDNEALFIGKGTERLQPGGVRAMLNDIAARAGVEHVHPHKFRRTLATNLIRHGMPIQEVASILGHEKLDTTMGYVVLDDEDLSHSYRRYT